MRDVRVLTGNALVDLSRSLDEGDVVASDQAAIGIFDCDAPAQIDPLCIEHIVAPGRSTSRHRQLQSWPGRWCDIARRCRHLDSCELDVEFRISPVCLRSSGVTDGDGDV